VTFPQNIPPAHYFPGAEEESSNQAIEVSLMKNQDPNKKAQRVVYASNDKFEWIGKNYGKSSDRLRSTKYLIGVYDKVQKKMKLCEGETVFNLMQFNREESARPVARVLADYEPRAQRAITYEELGSKKGKKKIQQMKNSIVEV
jgi:hypothetical protein